MATTKPTFKNNNNFSIYTNRWDTSSIEVPAGKYVTGDYYYNVDTYSSWPVWRLLKLTDVSAGVDPLAADIIYDYTISEVEQGIVPDISITDTFNVASQVAMLALAAQKGDIARRTDLNKSYILQGTNPTVLANWAEIGNIGSAGATITNDVATAASRYPTFASTTTGSLTTAYTADTKLYFNPSTGELSATGFTTLSDGRLKTDIKSLTDSYEVINSLNGVSFKFKETGKQSIGLIAQDVEKVVPEVVSESEIGIKSVNYPVLTAHLIEYVKTLENRINALEVK
jgi:hypothetical protein